MSSATLGIQGRRIAVSSQDLGQVLNGTLYGTTPVPPPLAQLDTLGARWAKSGKNFEASSSVSTYIPLQLPARPMDMPAKGGLFGKNLEPIGTTTAYVPLQIPARALDTPTTIQARAKNFEASYSQSVYVPPQPPTRNLDFPNVGLLRGKNIEASQNQTIIYNICYYEGAGSDNGEWSVGGTNFSSGPGAAFLGDGFINGSMTSPWMRFPSVPIAQGATVTSALLSVLEYSDNPNLNNVKGTIRGFAQDNATAPTSRADADSRPLTASGVPTGNLPAWTDLISYTFSDISGVIQEIVNRPGWVSGNAIVLVIIDSGSTVGAYRSFYGYASDPAKAPHLCITTGIQLPPRALDTPNVGKLRGKNWEPIGTTTLYVPVQPPHFHHDFPNVGGLHAKNIETSGDASAYIPLQLPSVNHDFPTIGRLYAKNHEPGGTWPVYIPPTPITRNYDWPTTNRHYAKRLPHAEYNGPIYIQSSVGLFSPYDAQIELPVYTEVIVLPAYLEELMLANYTGLLVTPIYSLESELPVYYSVRKL